MMRWLLLVALLAPASTVTAGFGAIAEPLDHSRGSLVSHDSDGVAFSKGNKSCGQNTSPSQQRFVILGDRTGEARPGVYEAILREAAAEKPAFAITVGDSIEGLHDETAAAEWRAFERLLKPFRPLAIHLTPGNHDIWSAASERLFREHAARDVSYSFDSGPIHCTVLDNSRTDEFSAETLAYLERDLKEHAAQPVKFIFSHRPSWLLPVAMRDGSFPLHKLARQYGVQYVVAGHIHQMLRFELEGVTYLSMPSAGGHLRNSEKYEDGWFFGHALVNVQGASIRIAIEELKSAPGQGRKSEPSDWGMAGLVKKR